MAAGSTWPASGMAQVDADGNVNVSRFGRALAGAGGFINISQNARKRGVRRHVHGGRAGGRGRGRPPAHRRAKASQRKFVEAVEQITFSGAYAAETGQPVLYVTERCVFRRTPDGMELIEVAPGIDIERDILAHMAFRPIVARSEADGRAHLPRAGHGAERHLLDLSLADRLSYDAERNTLFANFEGLQVRTIEDVERMRRVFEALCQRIGRKVHLIVNYDGFALDEALSDAYFATVS